MRIFGEMNVLFFRARNGYFEAGGHKGGNPRNWLNPQSPTINNNFNCGEVKTSNARKNDKFL